MGFLRSRAFTCALLPPLRLASASRHACGGGGAGWNGRTALCLLYAAGLPETSPRCPSTPPLPPPMPPTAPMMPSTGEPTQTAADCATPAPAFDFHGSHREAAHLVLQPGRVPHFLSGLLGFGRLGTAQRERWGCVCERECVHVYVCVCACVWGGGISVCVCVLLFAPPPPFPFLPSSTFFISSLSASLCACVFPFFFFSTPSPNLSPPDAMPHLLVLRTCGATACASPPFPLPLADVALLQYRAHAVPVTTKKSNE